MAVNVPVVILFPAVSDAVMLPVTRVSIASTVAFTHVRTLLASGHAQPVALTSGFSLAFWVLAGLGALSVIASLVLVRSQEVEAVDAEAMQVVA